MVLHFPSKLTEEEEQLQSKYAKLRRKKKQLQDVSKPKQEPEHNKIKKPSEAKESLPTNEFPEKGFANDGQLIQKFIACC